MDKRRTIIIGDVHGCFAELLELLRRADAKRSDRIIFVGDLITKGPASVEVLDLVQNRANCEAILGNHEYTLRESYCGRRCRLDAVHRDVIREMGKDYARHMKWISQLPSYVDLGEHIVVHAGLRPGVSIRRQSRRDLAFLRTLEGRPESRGGTPWFERYRGRKIAIFGHWVFDRPLIRPHAIGIDTGCVYGGSLTAFVLPDGLVLQVRARRKYAGKSNV